MPKHLIFLDFETYYDDVYSLRKMTPAEYILDRRYESLMVAVKVNGGPHHIVEGPEIPKFLSQFNPADTVTVTFNSLFDNSILAWVYGFVPGQMIDAMAMARALDGHRFRSFKLSSIAHSLGFPDKGDAVTNAKGKRRHHFSDAEWQEYKDYSIRDNLICEMIFLHYYQQMPKSELRLMDMVLRATIEPVFVGSQMRLEKHIHNLLAEEDRIMELANNIPKSHLLSTARFKQALIDAGFPEDEIEEKTTSSGNRIPAFAKTDSFMELLQEHPDPYICALATARIGARSRLEETRSRTLLRICELPWRDAKNHPAGTMPVPLRYGGAHTHRLSGDWKMNMQNLPRGSQLRYSLEAPKGHSVLTIDLGQIEARLVAWISGEKLLLEEFAKYDAGDKTYDPYNRLGSAIFGCAVDRKAADPIQKAMGFIGKTGILGLGYGCGREKFDTMVTTGARTLGVDISGIYSRELTHNAVTIYRARYKLIQSSWGILQQLLRNIIANPAGGTHQFNPVTLSANKLRLPNGMYLHYADIESADVMVDWKGNGQPEPRTEYTYKYGGKPYRIYGAKLLENICQALGRVIVMNAALTIKAKTGYRFVHQAHDELIYIIPDAELDAMKQIIHDEMTRPPVWGNDLPLVADVGIGKSYGDAK